MGALRFDDEQRFTCSQCGRCCRRGWDIALTAGEVEAYRRTKAARWYREDEAGPEGIETEPFEPIPGHPAFHRIRKRADGACGFLSQQGRCRIHEELGADRKPLTCRLFPFRFHPAEEKTVVTASFCCPTIVANQGATLASQSRDLAALRSEWSREHPEPTRDLAFVPGRPIDGKMLGTLRSILREMLDRPGPCGPPDLRANVGRMAHTLEDLSRYRVIRLSDDSYAEYIELTGRHAASSQQPLPPMRPSRLGRLLSRGFLFVVVAARLQLEDGRSSGLRLGLRLRLFRLLAHFHGLGPRVAAVDLGAARRASVDLGDPAVHGLALNYLRASLETLGTARRPVLEELAVSLAVLNAACVLAAMRAAGAGRTVVEAADFAEGLMDAADLGHAESEGLLGSMLGTLSGGVEALKLFACG